MLTDFLDGKQSLFATGFNTELRAQENRDIHIAMENGIITRNSVNRTSGVCARVYKNGFCGFSSSAELTPQAAEKVLKAATDNVSFLSDHGQRSEKKQMVSIEKGTFPLNKDIVETESQMYVEVLKFYDSYVTKNYKNIKARKIAVSEDSQDKVFYTSDGYSGHFTVPRSYVYVVLTSEAKDGSPISLFRALGGYGAFKDNFKDPSIYTSQIDETYSRLMQKRDGVYAEAGFKTVILGSDVTGMIAHEAVGHTVEADLVLGGSVAGPSLNKVVASPKVNLTDFAYSAFGKEAPLPIYVDDEGTKAEDVEIIKDGVLKGYMHNRESADHFGVKATGNARAWDFNDEPLIRMRNTAVLPGTDKLEDMIASIDDGYYLVDTGNGQADATGEFMFGINMGWEIKHGKLGRAILDTTVSGIAFEMLKTVDMVGDTIKWQSSGFCGKKQWIPVGMGGPDLKCKIMIGGR